MTGPPQVVELLGLAGAGKTTLARELVAGDPSLQLGMPLPRMRSALAQARSTAPFVVPYVREVRGTAWFSRYQVRGLGYLHAWRRSLDHPPGGRTCVLLDHGPLFWLATLDALGPPVTSTRSFRLWWDATLDDWIDLLDVVVWLDAPEELLGSRIQSRDQRHVLQQMDDAATQQFFHRYRTSYGRVLDRVRRRSPGALLSLGTDVSAPSALALRVRRRLAPGVRLDV